jgi:hypothetical protein
MINSAHNHQSILAKSHAVLRKIAIIKEIKKNVSRQLIVQIALFQILCILRVDSNIINSLIKSKDIYNIKTQNQTRCLKIIDFDADVNVEA